MRPATPKRPTGTSARQPLGQQPTTQRLAQRLERDPAWRVTTVDGLSWIDPFRGTVVPAPFGFDEPALTWLQQHRPWQSDGKQINPKPLAELQFLRWVHYLRTQLADVEQVWLRHFLPDGRWLNPFTGLPVAGLIRDNGKITMDTVRQLAVVLRDCPQAQGGRPLDREVIAARLRELTAPPPRLTPGPVTPVVRVEPSTRATTKAIRPDDRKPSEVKKPVEERRPAVEPKPAAEAKPAADQPRPADQRKPTDPTKPKPGGGQPPTEPSVRVVSGYRILGTLGMGGMSTVYRAVQLSMEREVALKVLDQNGPPDPAYTERFLREARSAGRISHPNVVTCYDVGVHHGNRLYMALELVTGGDATQLAERHGGRLPERVALGILRDAARGLGAIHAVGLIHRDIKPANLFIAADGSAKLGDLGLVRDITGTDSGKYRTLIGIAVGTPAFMSPEQSQGSKDVDIRSDLYALGASVWALLAGRLPYEAPTVFDMVSKIVTEPVPDIRSLRPDLSPVTAAILQKAMAKDRSARQQTPAELQTVAEDALVHLAEPTPGSGNSVLRPISLPPGSEKLRSHGYRVAEVRGKGLIVTLGLGGSVLCVAASGGLLGEAAARERLDIRLRQYLVALRTPPMTGQPEPSPGTLCRALLVDGLSVAIAQVELTQKSLVIGCTPGARAALVNPREAHVLSDVSVAPVPIAFPSGGLLVLSAGVTGKPFTLWGTVVGRCDQGADAVAAQIPLTAEGNAILVLGNEG